MISEAATLIDELDDLILCLARSRKVHQEWVDWYEEYPNEIAKNHTAGGPDHHKNAVAMYDRRIAATEKAIKYIQQIAPKTSCPLCKDGPKWTQSPASCFCDEHYRQWLMTYQCYPKDLDEYRANALEREQKSKP